MELEEAILELPGLLRCYEYCYYAHDYFEAEAIKREICYLLQISF